MSEPPQTVKKYYCGNCGREIVKEKHSTRSFTKCPYCGLGPIISKVVVKK